MGLREHVGESVDLASCLPPNPAMLHPLSTCTVAVAEARAFIAYLDEDQHRLNHLPGLAAQQRQHRGQQAGRWRPRSAAEEGTHTGSQLGQVPHANNVIVCQASRFATARNCVLAGREALTDAMLQTPLSLGASVLPAVSPFLPYRPPAWPQRTRT